MPDHEDKKSAKDTSGSEHDRAVRVVRAKLHSFAEKLEPVEPQPGGRAGFGEQVVL